MTRYVSGLLVPLLASTLVTSAASATTYYVNASCGDDGWSGTSSICAAPDGPKASIQLAINTTADTDKVLVAPGVYLEQINLHGKAITVQAEDGPSSTVIDAQGAGTTVRCVNGEGRDTVIEGFMITGGNSSVGGGMVCEDSSPTVRDCLFKSNVSEVTAGMRIYSGSPLVEGCEFTNNISLLAGCVGTSYGSAVFRDCLFRANFGSVLNFENTAGSPTYVNCRFISNVDTLSGGTIDGGSSLYANCVFSRNEGEGPENASVISTSETTMVNCTINESFGDGILVEPIANAALVNSIVWKSAFDSIAGGVSLAVSYSDIEGGWSGTGNIDVDPLFIQPGTGDVRLGIGSPCVDAGSDAALPPDALDLDADGDTSEPLPRDLDGQPRVQGAAVDMGAYEGEFAPAPPAEMAWDLDQGEWVILVPGGGDFDPLWSPAVRVANISGPDDATFGVTRIDWDLYPSAGGYSERSSILTLETSLYAGEFLASVFIPFGFVDLQEGEPQAMTLIGHDTAVDSWALGVAANVLGSPGYGGPVGDRTADIDGGPPSGSQEPGDYGIYWDPSINRGFVWAVVDHTTDYGVGMALCPSDCRQTPNGEVDVVDFFTLLAAWGGLAGGGPCDVDFDGVIDLEDLMALIVDWGVCPVAASAAAGLPARALLLSRSADLDGDGAVERRDLEAMKAAWGPCDEDNPADLDGDGRVGAADMLKLLSRWGAVKDREVVTSTR